MENCTLKSSQISLDLADITKSNTGSAIAVDSAARIHIPCNGVWKYLQGKVEVRLCWINPHLLSISLLGATVVVADRAICSRTGVSRPTARTKAIDSGCIRRSPARSQAIRHWHGYLLTVGAHIGAKKIAMACGPPSKILPVSGGGLIVTDIENLAHPRMRNFTVWVCDACRQTETGAVAPESLNAGYNI